MRRHREVPHPLRAPCSVLVLDHGDLVSELTDEAGLLLDFAKGTTLVGFARFALPLGKGPVVVPRSMDDEDLVAVAASRPHDHASCGADGLA
jgi:hypothetical protein